MLRYLKFSLRTLVFAALLAASAMLLHQNFAPWKLEKSFSLHNPPRKDIVLHAMHSVATMYFLVDGERIILNAAPNTVTKFPDGSFSTSTGWGYEIAVYDLISEKKTFAAPHPDSQLAYCLTSPKKPLLLSTPEGKPSMIIDPATGETLFTYDSRYIESFQSSDGRIVSAANDTTVLVVDTLKGKVLWKKNAEKPLLSISMDGSLAAQVIGTRGVLVLDAETGKELKSFTSTGEDDLFRYAIFNHDNSYVSAIQYDEVVSYWHCSSGKYVRAPSLSSNYAPPRMALHRSLMLCQNTLFEFSSDQQKNIPSADGSRSYDNGCFFPNGQMLLYDERADIRDSDSTELLYTFSIPSEGVHAAAVSQDGTRLALAGSEGTLMLWRNCRPEKWWGLAWRYEFWLTAAFALGSLISLIKDIRQHRALALQTSGR